MELEDENLEGVEGRACLKLGVSGFRFRALGLRVQALGLRAIVDLC